jgi:hypothetical protein
MEDLFWNQNRIFLLVSADRLHLRVSIRAVLKAEQRAQNMEWKFNHHVGGPLV